MSELEVWIYRGLIAFLVTIVLATLRTIFSSYKETQTKNDETFERLSKSIDSLNMMLHEIKETLAANGVGCLEKHRVINEKLNSLAVEIKTEMQRGAFYDKEIALIKQKILTDEKQNTK